jgi:site-specific recombinase XerD
MDFKKHLEGKQFSINTVRAYTRKTSVFLDWLKEENIIVEECSYGDMLVYMRRLNQNGHSKRYVNAQLGIIRHYFRYLIKQGKMKDNVADGLQVRGVSRRLPHDLLSKDVLMKLYQEFPCASITGKRNKVILGLMVEQGLKTEELAKLLPEHVMVEEGKIYVPGSRRSNSRYLKLAAYQVLELHKYMEKTRALILEVMEKESEFLFVSMGSANHFRGIMEKLIKNIRDFMPEIKSSMQIRSSVIALWLEEYNLREVQYMAGHRYVSSTEKYLLTGLDDLRSDVDNYFPLQ